MYPEGRQAFHMKPSHCRADLPTELLAHVLKATRERLEAQGLDVKGGAVQDIAVGTVLMELGGAKSGRLASLDAG